MAENNSGKERAAVIEIFIDSKTITVTYKGGFPGDTLIPSCYPILLKRDHTGQTPFPEKNPRSQAFGRHGGVLPLKLTKLGSGAMFMAMYRRKFSS